MEDETLGVEGGREEGAEGRGGGGGGRQGIVKNQTYDL